CIRSEFVQAVQVCIPAISGYITGQYPISGSERPMASKSQRKATATHRRRAAARGLVRVEVQAAKRDARLIRTMARALRGDPDPAGGVRSVLANSLLQPEVKSAFDVFGSDLPDEVFAGVFELPRDRGWREVEF